MRTVKDLLYPLLSLVIAVAFSSCATEAVFETEKVKLEADILDISSGYIRVAANTSKDAYYVVGALPKDVMGFDPINKPKQFCTLILDSLYSDYLDWRFYYLKQGEEHIAPFSSHCLYYNKAEVYLEDLTKNTDYWLYAFVVDPVENKPVGDLVLKTFRTLDPKHKDMHFDAKIDGYFVMVYPHGENDENLENTAPFVSVMVDSMTVDEVIGRTLRPGDMTIVGEMLYQRYKEMPWMYRVSHEIDKYSYEDDLWTPLVEGHKYYLLVAVIDGTLLNRTVFEFTWTGPDFNNNHEYLPVYFREGPDHKEKN